MNPVNNVDYKVEKLKKQIDFVDANQNFDYRMAYSDSMIEEINIDDTVYIYDHDTNLNETDIFCFETLNGQEFISRCKLLGNKIKLIFSNEACNNLTFKTHELMVIGKVRLINWKINISIWNINSFFERFLLFLQK